MMNRRQFIQWGSALPVTLSALPGAMSAQSVAQNTIVVIDAIDGATSPAHLSAVLDGFATQGLPASLIIEGMADTPAPITPQSEIAQLLRERHQNTPGLVELVPFAKDLAGQTAYFQARSAHEVQSQLLRAIWGADAGQAAVAQSRAIACDMHDTPLAPSGVRASGLRDVLVRPSVSTQVQPEAWDDGVVRLIGGLRARLDMSVDAMTLDPNDKVERVLYLSAADFAGVETAPITEQAVEFAGNVLASDSSGWANTILASDIQFRDAYGYQRNMALHFFLRADASEAERQALIAFRLELIDAGLPSSFGQAVGTGITGSDETGYWISVEGVTRRDLPIRPLDVFTQSARNAIPPKDTANPGAYGMSVRLRDLQSTDTPGIDTDNNLVLPVSYIADQLSTNALAAGRMGTGDFAVVISDEILGNRSQQNLIKSALQKIAADGITRAVSLPDYVRNIVPNNSYITHHRRAISMRSDTQDRKVARSDAQLATLMADAAKAWSYFDRWTNRTTGLCPATVNFAGGSVKLHETVTMWDVGSQINALIAAVDLGFIDKGAFQAAIKRILPNIAGRSSQGRLLPQGWIATDKFKWGTKDFDGCDAGRLMSALYNLDSHPLAKEKAARTVASWDLEKVINDGVIYSVKGGELRSTLKSHCAHYSAWAFRTWGPKVVSPYEVMTGQSATDGEMALLEASGKIGPMGAEPLLMEALEMGMSPESEFLAEVLFAAQLEEYQQSGNLTAVSESPIDRAPWFVYAGLQFDAPGRTWATDTVDSLEEHRSEAFRKKNLIISSKAAFLWSAYRNHAYCDELVAYVRERAATKYGFASGIYQQTGNAPAGYTDINTNAVILQSVAHIVRNNA